MANEETILAFFRARPGHSVTLLTPLAEALDSLAFLDLFLLLEDDDLSLDKLVGCRTVGDVIRLVRGTPVGASDALRTEAS